MARTRPTTSVHTGQPAVKTSTCRFADLTICSSPFVRLKALENRTPLGRLAGFAGSDQVFEHTCHSFEITQLGFDLGELGLRPPLDITTSSCRVHTQVEQTRDLFKREPERLGVLDEPETTDNVVAIETIPGRFSCRRSEQLESLVIADGLDIDPNLFG